MRLNLNHIMQKTIGIDGTYILMNTLDGPCGKGVNSEWECSQVNTKDQKFGKLRDWLSGAKSGKTFDHSDETTQAGQLTC